MPKIPVTINGKKALLNVPDSATDEDVINKQEELSRKYAIKDLNPEDIPIKEEPLDIKGLIRYYTTKGQLKTLGAVGGGVVGGMLGAPALGAGAVPGAIAGAGLGAGAGAGLENLIAKLLGEGRSTGEELKNVGLAIPEGALSEMGGMGAGAVLGKMGEKVLTPMGKGAKYLAKRVMSSTVKNPELAEEMLKRGEWGRISTLKELGESKSNELSRQIDDIMAKVKKVGRENATSELDKLRKAYKKLPNRQTAVDKIESAMKEVWQSPADKEMFDYTKMTGTGAQGQKKSLYKEQVKQWQGKNYDPSSTESQIDMAISRGLKKDIEKAAPKVGDINKDLAHYIELAAAMEGLGEKIGKSNMMQLRPMLAGMGFFGGPAGIPAAVGANLLGTTSMGTGAATALNKIGQNLTTRSGTPLVELMTQMMMMNR